MALLAPAAHRFRPRVALLLLATLLLGYAAHGWHHLSDPDCDAGRGPGSHPCTACSALHGSVLASEDLATIAPAALIERAAVAPAISRLHSAPVAGATRPRAPPAA